MSTLSIAVRLAMALALLLFGGSTAVDAGAKLTRPSLFWGYPILKAGDRLLSVTILTAGIMLILLAICAVAELIMRAGPLFQ